MRLAAEISSSRTSPVFTLPRLDRGIRFAAAKRDRPVKPGQGEQIGEGPQAAEADFGLAAGSVRMA